jgi:hypothetical protein
MGRLGESLPCSAFILRTGIIQLLYYLKIEMLYDRILVSAFQTKEPVLSSPVHKFQYN